MPPATTESDVKIIGTSIPHRCKEHGRDRAVRQVRGTGARRMAEAEFRQGESHRGIGLDARRRGGVEPARHVEGEDRCRRGVRPLDEIGEPSREVAGQAVADQRVDDQVGGCRLGSHLGAEALDGVELARGERDGDGGPTVVELPGDERGRRHRFQRAIRRRCGCRSPTAPPRRVLRRSRDFE